MMVGTVAGMLAVRYPGMVPAMITGTLGASIAGTIPASIAGTIPGSIAGTIPVARRWDQGRGRRHLIRVYATRKPWRSALRCNPLPGDATIIDRSQPAATACRSRAASSAC